MPTFVNPDKCDGCKALDRPACHHICPHDLMVLDEGLGKAVNREPDACWECYSCVKICPQGAIDMRGYADVMPMGGSMVPMRGTDSIIWTANFRDGTIKRFRFPIRTTPWGTIEPYKGFPEPQTAALKQQHLFGEPQMLEVDLPTLKH